MREKRKIKQFELAQKMGLLPSEVLDAAHFAIEVAHKRDCPFGKPFAPKSTCECNYHAAYRAALSDVAKVEPPNPFVAFQAKLSKGGAAS
jgi:hypothetical protein